MASVKNNNGAIIKRLVLQFFEDVRRDKKGISSQPLTYLLSLKAGAFAGSNANNFLKFPSAKVTFSLGPPLSKLKEIGKFCKFV